MIRVMVVEDYDVIREDIVESISRDPEIVVVASFPDAKSAVEYYGTDPGADIVLMDIEMEEMDSGIRAAERILSTNEDAKIIFLTSHDSDAIIVSALATGAEDYVIKGASPEEIISHIHDVYENHAQLDAKVQRVVMGEYKRLRQSEQSLLYFIQHLGSLTPAEKDLVSCFLAGLKVRQIAEKRGVEASTIKSQIRTLLQKFGCSRSSEIVKIIQGLGIGHLFRNDGTQV